MHRPFKLSRHTHFPILLLFVQVYISPIYFGRVIKRSKPDLMNGNTQTKLKQGMVSRRLPSLNNLSFFALFLVLPFISVVTSVHANETLLPSVPSSISIGVVLDLDSPMGSMLNSCLSMALSDFYSVHANYESRLFLRVKNAKEELEVASAVMELLNNEEVHGVVGPEWLSEAALVAELGARAHVPVVSFTAKSRSFSHSQNHYFVRTALDDMYQVKGLAAICQTFKWNEIVVFYEDTEYGNLFLSKVNKVFQEMDIQLLYTSASSTSNEDDHITKELNKIKKMNTRVFLVHMDILLGHRLFLLASKAGMMSEGHVWFVTDSLSNFLNSVDSDRMEGVLGIRPYVPKSKNLENFKARWKNNALLTKPESTAMELNIYGLWAYDTLWALAMAIEKILPSKSDYSSISPGENGTEISNLRVSKIGPRVLNELLQTNFTGLSGKFQLVDGQLQPSAFEIFNVIGTGDRTVGYWTPGRGMSKNLDSNSSKELKAIMWPGETLTPPKAFPVPATGKLKVGVPKKEGFTKFVNVQIDPVTNQFNVSGFSIDVFLASLQLLPFKLDFEFIPFMNVTGYRNGSYTDMLNKILDQTYDFVVGDITILADRATYVDFTLPYTDSGVVMVVKNRRNIDMWSFLKPLKWDLWLTIFVACIFVGVVLRIMERERNNTNTGSSTPQGQKVEAFFFPIAALAFPERDMVANKWSKFVLIVWLFAAYVLMQSYTAKLSSIFTVDQLDFVFSEDNYVGHQLGSYVKDFLINELHLNQSKLKSYRRFEEYHDAMNRGGRKGGIDAIAGEIPYMKLFLSRYGSEYRIAGKTYKTSGFGFAFPNGSPLVSYFSKAILNITQGPIITTIEKKNLGPGYPADSINRDNSSLTAFNFGGLFVILCSATIIALFCSETPAGQRLATMASSNIQRCCTFTGKESSSGSVTSSGDVSGDSSREEVNRNQEISNTTALNLPGEVHETNLSIACVSASQGEGELSDELSNINDASSGPTVACVSV